MSLKELFEVIPQLLSLFVPGFVFIFIYRFFVEKQEKESNSTIIGSVVLGYIFHLIATLICTLFNGSEYTCTVISILVSIIFSVLVVKIRLTKIYKKTVIKIGKITGEKNIWYNFFDQLKGTRIRFYSNYNNKDSIIEGDVKYYEACDGGECIFVISNFKISFDNKEYTNNNIEAKMIFNSKNICGIEAMYGKR